MLPEEYKQYNAENTDLRKHQQRMLMIMEKVDEICRKHAIPYWLSSGTTLGAVRHGGFIPWDDDMDIEVLRKDYKRLLALLEVELPSSLVVQTSQTDPYYVAQFAKVRDTTSRIVENDNLSYKYNGIFIDIFPMERCCKFISRLTAFLHYHLMYKLVWRKKDRWGIKRGLIAFVKPLLEKGIYPFLRIFSFLESKNVLRYPLGVGFFSERRISEIFPLKDIIFEGKSFQAPYDEDAYLKRLYGDYMKLPSSEEIQPHSLTVEFDVKDENRQSR